MNMLLFLLLCPLLATGLENNEILEQSKTRPEVVNVPEQPQPCPSDVHAVLREMSAKLAENRLMIQQLQTLCKEHAAKLKEVDAIKRQQEEQGDKVNTLNLQQQEQAKKLKALQTNELDPLKEQLQVRQVAFSASLAASDPVHIGPINRETNLVFPNVFSNTGSAYSPITGFFTAPVRGVYHFEYYIAAGGGSHGSAVGLRKNGHHIVSTWEHQTNGQSKSANGVTLLLEPNDTVGLYLGANLVIWDNLHHHSTFNGHMLFPM